MAEIRFNQVVKRFGNVTAVDNLNLEVKQGELISLLGPSGCGKTTALRLLAGFERPTSGTLEIGGKVVNDLPPQQREIGIVFQDYAVFPTMTVFDNVAYGLRLRKVGGAELKRRVDETLGLVGLDGFQQRMPSQLSGGQLQRVALARALVIRPRVLLLDEPLSNLDAALRLSIRKQIRKIQQELGMTTVFVTHDQEEAMSISDRVAVMRTAQLMQVDAPMKIYEEPSSAFVANFIGRTTLKQGKVTAADSVATRIDVGGVELVAKTRLQASPGTAVWVSVRPQHVQYVTDDAGASQGGAVLLRGVIDYLEPLGAVVRGEVRAERGGHFLFEIADPLSRPVPSPGASATFAIRPEHVVYGLMTDADRALFSKEADETARAS